MKIKDLPDINYLNELLRVDKQTGVLYWKERKVKHFSDGETWSAEASCNRWNTRYAGKVAGSKCRGSRKGCSEYLQIRIRKQRYPAHRIVYAMTVGPISNGPLIDHIDGNTLNNVPSNLRLCDHEINAKNARRHKNNTSGCLGVSWFENATFSGWQVRARVNKKTKVLKYTKDFFEACCARKSAENRFGYHPSHGRLDLGL
jgi:hypothetical protein